MLRSCVPVRRKIASELPEYMPDTDPLTSLDPVGRIPDPVTTAY